jgi:HK97 family phage prohead protease
MKGLIEKRSVPFEVRASDDGKRKLRGLAVVFNSEAVIGGYFREVIRPGAFTKTLAERDIKMLWNHDTNFPLGSTRAGTLALHESSRGLEVDNDPPSLGMNAGFLESVERGDVSQMSFGFEVVKENVVREEGDMDLREIIEVKLWEVSPVTFPAYTDTEIGLRAAEVRAGWVKEGILPEALVRAGDDSAEGDTTLEPDPNAIHSVEPGEAATTERNNTRAMRALLLATMEKEQC